MANAVKKVQRVTRPYSGVTDVRHTPARAALAKKIRANRKSRTPYGMRGTKSVGKGKYGIEHS